MKPFRFNLETLLRLRESEKERAQEGFARALGQRQSLEAEMAQIHTARDALQAQAAEERTGTFSASEQTRFLELAAVQAETLAALQARRQEALKAEGLALEAFKQSRRKVDALEKLKERRRQAHVAEAFRVEEREVEALANARRAWALAGGTAS